MTAPVSVVVPTIPRNPYLREALASVAAQTHADWEVVVTLDGESGENRDAAEGLADGRIRFVSTPSRGCGPAVARNLGLEAATHDLVAFLDSDDVCHPARLATQVQVFERHPDLGLLATWAQMVTDDGATVGRLHSPVGRRNVAARMLWRNCLTTSTIMTRRSVLADVGAFDPRCLRLEDYELWLRVLARYDIDVIGRELLSYRVHPGQYSRGGLLGRQTRLLYASRRRAAGRLGVGSISVGARHAAWLAYQIAKRRW